MDQLPIINCDDCGACCATMCSPPGYVAIIAATERGQQDEWPVALDVIRVGLLPPEADKLLRDYIERGRRDGFPKDDQPCIWLDLETKRCRFYEDRPQICRDFEVGSEGCRSWRDEFNIDVERITGA